MTNPTWLPDPQVAERSRIARFRMAAEGVTGASFSDTPDLHAWSIADPGAFWTLVWQEFAVVGEPGAPAYEASTMPEARFFPHARLNLAENLLARWHEVEDTAVVSLAEIDGEIGIREQVSGRELCRRVAAFAAYLRAQGIVAGDRVGIIMPVEPDALVCTLGALAIGAVVSSVSPEFGAPAIVDRLGQLAPRVLIVAERYRWNGREFHRSDNVAEVIRALPGLSVCLTSDAEPSAEVTAAVPPGCVLGPLAGAMIGDPPLEFTRLPFDHPAYVLFSSGTTGKPKCLIHRAGGVLLKHLVEVGLHTDVNPGDRLLYYTTTSWMMWNWEISCLAVGAVLVLFDGAPTFPRDTALFDAARVARATHLGVSARLVDHLRGALAPIGEVLADTPVRMVLVTGSPLSEPSANWLAMQVGPQVMINPISGGTDLVGCFVIGDPTRPFYAGEMTGPVLGMDVDVFEDGIRASDEQPGELVCLRPFPTVPVGIWGDTSGERLKATYFDVWPGVWVHGDRAVRSRHGGFAILGRSDATLNVGGVRIGTAEIYAALADHPAVLDVLAFGQEWDEDTRIVLLVVPPDGVVLDADTRASITATIRTACSPRHVPGVIVEVADLPRTQTGKLSELAVREAVHGREVKGRTALANPESLDAIVDAVSRVSA